MYPLLIGDYLNVYFKHNVSAIVVDCRLLVVVLVQDKSWSRITKEKEIFQMMKELQLLNLNLYSWHWLKWNKSNQIKMES